MPSNRIPLVSVITICLNAESTIRKTILSVLNQTYKNIEYIIIDGKSRDETLSIIKEYESKIDKVISEEDEGISSAFNKGIKLARGEYIQFVNADDYLSENKIEESVQLFGKYPSASFVHGDLILFNENNKKIIKLKGGKFSQFLLPFFMPAIRHPTLLVKKEAYELVGEFDERWKLAMDYDWLIRAYRLNQKGVYSKSIIVYMKEGGASEKNYINTFREVREISVLHGLNANIAYIIYSIKYTKHFIRLKLEKILPHDFVMSLWLGKKKYKS